MDCVNAAFWSAIVEKISMGIDKGKSKILSNIPPRNPIVKTTNTAPKRLKIGVPIINVIKIANSISFDRERSKPRINEIIISGIPNVNQCAKIFADTINTSG